MSRDFRKFFKPLVYFSVPLETYILIGLCKPIEETDINLSGGLSFLLNLLFCFLVYYDRNWGLVVEDYKKVGEETSEKLELDMLDL